MYNLTLLSLVRRGLLDDVCKGLLQQARDRGWVAPKDEPEMPTEFSVRYLGSASLEG